MNLDDPLQGKNHLPIPGQEYVPKNSQENPGRKGGIEIDKVEESRGRKCQWNNQSKSSKTLQRIPEYNPRRDDVNIPARYWQFLKSPSIFFFTVVVAIIMND